MPYNESHTELRDHPKTKRLKRALGETTRGTIGLLQCLWWWVMDYAPNGDLTRFEAADIADAAEWDGDADQLVRALVECGVGGGSGFLERTDDGRLVVHDWFDYYNPNQDGRLRREWDRLRPSYAPVVLERDGYRCRYCGADNALTVDHVQPLVRGGANVLSNLVAACRSCNSKKHTKTLEEWQR